MKAKEMADYVPLVQKLADTAIGFLADQGLRFPENYPMPELRLSLERRVKVHGIYNKHNVLAELRRLQHSFIKADIAAYHKSLLKAFLEKLALFLDGRSIDASGIKVWLQIEHDYYLLEKEINVIADLSFKSRLWQQLVRLLAKVKELEIKQQLSGVFSSEGRITLYMNNIEAICYKQGLDMKAYLQSVLVHEYTHACHYAAFMEARLTASADKAFLDKALLCWSGVYLGKGKVAVVKESLARYLQVLWCQINEPKLSIQLTTGDYGEYVIQPNWPYAGAQGIVALPRHEARLLFCTIWQASIMDWEQAYELLGASINNMK